MIRLSKREKEVWLGIARGDAPKRTAEEMKLSVKTVSTYRNRLMMKLGIKSTSGLAIMAYQLGLVSGMQAEKLNLYKEINSDSAKRIRRKAQSGVNHSAGSIDQSTSE